MSLLKRLEKLEDSQNQFQLDDQLIIFIKTWDKEVEAVKFDNHRIERIHGENEEEFLNRAETEVRKLADPDQKVLTVFGCYPGSGL